MASSAKQFLAAFLLIASILAVYLPSVKNNGFVNWDDDSHLLQNSVVERADLRQIFTSTVNRLYIPLSTLSFAVERKLFGLDPFVYHLNNMLLHIGVSLLVMMLARRLGLGLGGALISALIFGLHPMHVESVAWVTERKDVLYSLFYLGSLYVYTFYIKEPSSDRKKWFYGAAMALGLLSLLAKPMALTLLFAFFVFDWFLGRAFSRQLILEKIPLAIVVGAGGVWLATRTYSDTGLLDLTFPDSPLKWAWSLVFYLQKFFLPDFFVLRYAMPQPVSFLNIEYAAAGLILALGAASLWVFRRFRLYLFGVIFFGVSVSVVLRLEQVADRFMYLPSMGFCFCIGSGAEALLKHRFGWVRGAVLASTLGIVAGLGWMAYGQTQVWKDSVALWEHQLTYQPQKQTALIYLKIGQAYMEDPGFREAVARFQQVKGKKMADLAVSDRIAIERDVAHIARIVGFFQRSLEINPEQANTYFHLGRLYFYLGNLVAAQESALKAVFYQNGHYDAYFLLGQINEAQGLYQESLAAFEKSIEVYPGHRPMLHKVLAHLDVFQPAEGDRELYGQARAYFQAKFGNM